MCRYPDCDGGNASGYCTPYCHQELGHHTMNFGQAIERLKDGQRMQRAGWNGKGMYIELQRPDKMSKMSLPYIFMSTVHKDKVPWLASQTDMLAEDWREYTA